MVNDICYFIKDSSLYNYADDNTVAYAGYDLDKLISILENDNLTLIAWFTANQVKANPGKLQVLAIGNKTHAKNIIFSLNENLIKCEDEDKLLVVTNDYNWNLAIIY